MNRKQKPRLQRADLIFTPDDAYNVGWGARMVGKPKDSNPFVPETDLWLWFATGWNECEWDFAQSNQGAD